MAQPASGLMASLRRLAANASVILGTRLELLANELEEEKLRLARLFLLGALATLFASLAVLLLTVLLVVLFWDSHRELVLGSLAGLFAVLAFFTARALRDEARAGSRLFSASLVELRKDRQRLTEEP